MQETRTSPLHSKDERERAQLKIKLTTIVPHYKVTISDYIISPARQWHGSLVNFILAISAKFSKNRAKMLPAYSIFYLIESFTSYLTLGVKNGRIFIVTALLGHVM